MSATSAALNLGLIGVWTAWIWLEFRLWKSPASGRFPAIAPRIMAALSIPLFHHFLEASGSPFFSGDMLTPSGIFAGIWLLFLLAEAFGSRMAARLSAPLPLVAGSYFMGLGILSIRNGLPLSPWLAAIAMLFGTAFFGFALSRTLRLALVLPLLAAAVIVGFGVV